MTRDFHEPPAQSEDARAWHNLASHMFQDHGFLDMGRHLIGSPMTLPEMQWHHREAHMAGDRVDGPIGPGGPGRHVHDDLPLGHPMPEPGDYVPFKCSPSYGSGRMTF